MNRRLLRIILVTGFLLLVVIAITVPILLGPPQDFSRYERLRNPRITTKPRQRMITAEVKGDPNKNSGKALGALFRTAYQLKGKGKGFEVEPPRARWSGAPGTPVGQLRGEYAIPIPERVEIDPAPGVKVKYWDYGPVAEILHEGPYSKERPTVSTLERYIRESGYKIVGEHEEEYLKGPGMFCGGNPEGYLTIIRYRVVKR